MAILHETAEDVVNILQRNFHISTVIRKSQFFSFAATNILGHGKNAEYSF